jgi:PAS domain S-box-containing protein
MDDAYGVGRPARDEPLRADLTAALIRSRDWSQSPLGPADAWPAALRVTLATCLAAPFPALVCWGEALVPLYNDPFGALLGDAHPAALGQTALAGDAALWPSIGPLVRAAYEGGAATTLAGLALASAESERTFDVACIPVAADAAPGGVLVTLSEGAGRARRELGAVPAGAQERMLAAVVENMPIGVGLADKAGNFLLKNRQMQRFVRNMLPAMDPIIVERWTGWDEHGRRIPRERYPGMRALGGETVPGVEFSVRDAEGRETWVRFGAAPVRDADGHVAGVVCIAEDIQAAKQAEQALRESAERFRLAADASGTMVYEVELTTDLVTMAHGLDRLLGDRAMQAPFSAEAWRALVHPDDRDGDFARVERSLHDPAVTTYAVRYRLRHADGSWRDVEDRGTVLRATDGTPRRVIGAARDVTRERRAEQRLRASERRLDAVLANTRMAVFLMDDRQYCVYMNRAAELLTGYTLADTEGRPLHDVVHHTRPDGTPYPLAECPIDRAFPTLAQQEGEETFVHRDGTFYPVAFTASPMRDDAGVVVGTVIEVRDVREERRTREALHQADRRKDEFIATLSHELRNPLAPLRNGLHVLRLAGKGDAAEAPIIDMMERQVTHLVRLIDDLLELSRISSGALELRRSRIDVADVVRNAVETVQPLIDAAAHRLDIVLPTQPLPLHGDPVRLAQILANLLNNAAKYTDPGGRITVTAARDGTMATIRVRDTGTGIAAQDLERMFEMFVRGDRTNRRAQSGLGIGLALSQRLAEMHGGRVTAASGGPGRGSEFTLRLPLAAAEADADVGAGAHAATPAPMRILVVDDNRDAGDSLALILRLLGAEVRIARDGPEALDVFERFDAGVVLLDIGMPGMDGYEVARCMRAAFPARHTRLVALTGWGQEEDRRLAREAGFDHHLVKPADLETLQALLASFG